MEQSKQFPEALFFPKGSKAILLLHAYTGSYNDVRMHHYLQDMAQKIRLIF